MMKKLFFILIIISFASCGHYPYPKEVVKALLESGDNKKELLKFLEYYRDNDSLKYEAACFLVGNMPYHCSTVQYKIDSLYFNYFASVDSILDHNPDALNDDTLKQLLGTYFDSLPSPELTRGKPDVQILSADYLIRNVEQAFEMWHQSPLLRDVSFDEFKEWILPYRTYDEALTDDKSQLYHLFYRYLNKKGMEDIRCPLECYKERTALYKKVNKHIKKKKMVGAFSLYLPLFKMDCRNLGIRTSNFFRACGIPVVFEFTPQWVAEDVGHYWCASPDSTQELQPYTPPYNNLREDWELSLKNAGKVYQINYGVSSDSPYFIKNKNESIPSTLNIPFIKDVTDRYHNCTQLSLPVPDDYENNLAYLCFFRKGQKNPIAWGKVNHDSHFALFDKVPLNILFIPALMENNQLKPLGAPFLLRKDSATNKIIKKDFLCDLRQHPYMRLYRKYPPKPYLVHYMKQIKNSCLVASNRKEGPYDTLFVLKDILSPYWQEYKLSNFKKYRFYWFRTKPGIPINIAEFEFLGKKTTSHAYSAPTPLPVFSLMEAEFSMKEDDLVKIEGVPLQPSPLYMRSYDNNPETYSESPYLGMDFTTPVCISSIRLLPRNAMNTIEPGCRYQLLYYKDDQWIEHETTEAIYNFVDFADVPRGTTYWLRNLDKGKEELPFFYIEGKQVFINEFMK